MARKRKLAKTTDLGILMSQSETYMLIILGFAICTLFALVIGRLAWKLALLIGARRAMRNVPSTVSELQTDRDRLRADHAMMASKLEFSLNDMKMRSAEQTAEVTRTRNRFETLSHEVTTRDVEIAELRSKINMLETEKAANLESIGFMRSSLEAKEIQIAALEKDLSTRPPPILAEDAPAQDRLQNRITEFTALSTQMSKQREVVADEGPKFTTGVFVKPAGGTDFKTEKLPEKENNIERAAAQLQGELQRLDQAWAEEEASQTGTDPIPDTPPRRAITNVVSLAQRIKALQKTIVN
jgi:chromosome segregation ATPase